MNAGSRRSFFALLILSLLVLAGAARPFLQDIDFFAQAQSAAPNPLPVGKGRTPVQAKSVSPSPAASAAPAKVSTKAPKTPVAPATASVSDSSASFSPKTASADKIPFDPAVSARLKSDVVALSAFQSRVPGTPDYARAAQWVETRFRAAGLENVRVETFKITVPVTKKCELTVNGQALKLLPVYPNSVIPACTPEAGFSGQLIYAGAGRAVDFNGQVVQGNIVALDFNSGMNWITAADLGARAVIFLEPAEMGTRGEAETKFSNLPVEFPRFYAPRATANAILSSLGLPTGGAKLSAEQMLAQKPASARLLSLVKWERQTGRNILGELKGTDAERAKKPGDTLVMNAYFDSMSIVPDRAPGAEAAGNMAALIELARHFKANKMRPYSLLFVANGAHHVALGGVRNFLAQHFLERKDSPVKKDKDDKDIKEPAFYRGFIGLDLTSRTGTVGLVAKSAFYNQMGAGSENILLNQFADYAKQINEWVQAEAENRQVKPETFYVDGVTGKDGRSWRSYMPSAVALDSEAATMAQKAGISFVTANDVRALQDTPFDLPQYVNTDNLARQVGTVAWVLDKTLGPLPEGKATKEKSVGADLLPESSLFSQNFGYAIGRAIYRNVRSGTSFLPDTPIPDEHMPRPKDILTPEDEKTMLADIARLQSSEPKQAKEIQERLERRRERQGQQEEDVANLRGTMAVGQILDRNNFQKSYSGVRGALIERAEFSNGTPPVAQFVFVGPRVGDPKGGGTPDAEIEAFSVNSAGRVIFAPDMGSERLRFSPKFKKTNQTLNFSDEKTNKYAVDASTICFDCRGTALHDTLDQRYFTVLSEMTVLDAQTDANPVEFGFMAPLGGGPWKEPIAIVFSKPNARFKLIMAAGLLGKRLVVLHTGPRTQEELDELKASGGQGRGSSSVSDQRPVYPEGNGVFVSEDSQTPNSVVHVAYQTARDLWSLDQNRISLLKSFGISNERVDQLHKWAGGDGKDAKGIVQFNAVPNGGALGEADKALKNNQYDQFYLSARRAFGFESRAYPDVEATSQDVLKGIIFYLALLLPFSFFVERLVFGFTDVRGQIMGTGGAFLLVFGCIRYVHPAFELALTPFIILLAFIILALTVVVTSFLSGKFEAEIKRLKQGVHFADVGRLSALGAAFSLGIANMKRRATRTALTCVTLVLLTFTVLSFTSVTANITNFAKVWAPENTPQYRGVLVRQPDWSAMPQAAVTSMVNEFRQKFKTVALRAWYLSPNQGETLYLRVNNAQEPAKFFHAPALLGLTPAEKGLGSPIANTLISGRWFSDDERLDVCIVPKAMLLPPQKKPDAAPSPDAEKSKIPENTGPPLGLTPENALGQKIQAGGQIFEIIGIFDNDKWFPNQESVKTGARPLYDIDGEEFTPVDYSNDQNKTAQQNNQLAGQKGEEVQVQRYQHMDANAMLLLPYQAVINMGGSTRSISAGFTDLKAGQIELEDIMNRAALGIFGTSEEDGKRVAKLYSSVESAGYEGFAALVVPILIAALIIANTMLGSVYERTREIGIYSAVGLAPIHVAALFIAEAFVYAVLGSISGYLVAQIVAKILTMYNLLPGITLNYSSSSAIIATLIVMATVLLSTLYPAWAASRMSQPDIERKWKLNPPIGDLWRLKFPFTVSGQQPLGVAQFLADFFETHTDTSVGKFYTDKVYFTFISLRGAVDVLNEGLPLAGAAPSAANGSTSTKGKSKDGKLQDAKKAESADEGLGPAAMLLNLSSIAASPDTVIYRLSMRVWLAPFDMGVSQDADIVLVPSAEPGLYELQLRLMRQSGEIAAWQRVNRGFLGDLRKQLLLWRTLTPEMQQEYILRGRAHVQGQSLPIEEPGAAVGTMG